MSVFAPLNIARKDVKHSQHETPDWLIQEKLSQDMHGVEFHSALRTLRI